MKTKVFTGVSLLDPPLLSPHPLPLLGTLSLFPVGGGEEHSGGMRQQGGRATEPREPEQLEEAGPPAHQVHQHLGCLFSLVPHHGVQAGGWRGSRGMGSWGAQACPPPCGERALGEIWRESELRAQHFPLSVFLLEEFFSPLSADDFTISWTWGKETLAFAPRPPQLQRPDKLLRSTRSQSFRVS